MHRHWELDALRGLMLLLMTVTHLPSRLTSPVGQPFGYVSAAEGFVFLAAYMCGWIYGRTALKRGELAMRQAFWRRALKVYGCHALTLLFLFTVIAGFGLKIDQPAVTNLISFYLQQPLTALWSGLLLLYQPPLLDILPLYVLFMLASPWLLAYALRRGWTGILVTSASLWLLAQFGLGTWLHGLAAQWFGMPVPLPATGAFSTFAWQFLWVGGLWLGARRNQSGGKLHFPDWLLATAVLIAVTGFVWRHVEGQTPFLEAVQWRWTLDKWDLGPLRMLNLIALGTLLAAFGAALARRVPRLRWLEMMGAASLPVFCAHLVVVLLALTFVGDSQERPLLIDIPLLVAAFFSLYAVARITKMLDVRRARALRKGRRRTGVEPTASPAAGTRLPVPTRLALPGDLRSPTATGDSPTR